MVGLIYVELKTLCEVHLSHLYIYGMTVCSLNAGYAYAGVQHGTFCHCGSSYGQFGALPESACNVPCTGDAHQTCGGSWSSSVYNTISRK